MGASPAIDSAAFSDPRYDVLAALCGFTDADHARGKMLRIWSHCTSTQHYTIGSRFARAILGPDAIDALVASELGEIVADPMPTIYATSQQPAVAGELLVRIRGTAGRIEWLGAERSKSIKGGQARANGAKRLGGRFLPAQNQPGTSPPPAGAGEIHQQATSVTPARTSPPTPTPTPTLKTNTHTRARGSADLLATVWQYAAERHAVERDRCSESAQPWPALISGTALEDLPARLAEAKARVLPGDEAAAIDICKHVVDVKAAQALSSGSLKYFTPSWIFEKKSFWISAESSIEQATREPTKNRQPAPSKPHHIPAYKNGKLVEVAS